MRQVVLQMSMSLDGYVASGRKVAFSPTLDQALVQPLALGGGHALFADLTAPVRLDLIEARNFEPGVVAQIYRPRNG